MSSVTHRSSLLSIFFTFAVDNLGATIVFPLFAPLFLEEPSGLFDSTISLSFKTMLLGLFLAIYPLMQFMFAPIMGEYGDHYGRKKALLITTSLTCLGYLCSTFGIHHRMLLFIFLSRLIMGVGAGNLSICLSSLADLSPGSVTKVRYYSYGSAVAGLTFILGPFLGGKLSDPSVHPTFSPSFPMLIGTILSALNILFVALAFEETLPHPSTRSFDLIRGLRNIWTTFKTPAVRPLYLLYFFYLFSWNVIFLFVPAFVVEKFHFSNSHIGDVCALLGGCWIFGTAAVHRLLSPIVPPRWLLLASLTTFAGLVVFIPYFHSIQGFLVILGSCTILAGLSWPICTGALSNAAPSHIQGKVLGLSQSMLSLTMVLSSVLGALFLQAHFTVPFAFAALASLVAAFLSVRGKVT